MNNVDTNDWRAWLAEQEAANFLQSPEWGKANEKLGHAIVIRGNGTSGYLGIIKDARRGRYLEVPGALIDDEDLAEATKNLAVTAKEHGCVFVRLRSQQEESDDALRTLEQHGWRKSPMHLHAEHTNIVDITPSEDDLLAAMRRQTRYEVRRVAKKGITVEAKPAAELVDEFYEVQQDTAARQGFIPPSLATLQAIAGAFGDDALIYQAEQEGQLLNMALVLRSGKEVDYYEAASTPEARGLPGAYGIIWQAIQDAKRDGYERLNLWGIAYSEDPGHRYAGVTTFKRGFGGKDVAYVPAHDLVINRPKYVLNWLVETIRKKKRGL